MFAVKKNELSYGRGYVYSLQYHLICGIRRIVPLPGYNRYRYLKTDMTGMCGDRALQTSHR